MPSIGRRLATRMRIKIDAMIAVEFSSAGLEIRQILRRDVCGQGCHSSIDKVGELDSKARISKFDHSIGQLDGFRWLRYRFQKMDNETQVPSAGIAQLGEL